MEQELPERSLLMVRPTEEAIDMQIVQEARPTKMMHFLEKLEERGVLNKVEVGDAVSFIAPIYCPWRSPWSISYKVLG